MPPIARARSALAPVLAHFIETLPARVRVRTPEPSFTTVITVPMGKATVALAGIVAAATAPV
jgi:hypothetical protein